MTLNRREALAAMGGLALASTFAEAQANLAPFWKSRLSDVDAAVKDMRKGSARVLVKSAGGRDVHLIAYGEKNDLKSSANYNSACGGTDPASYARKDGTQRPTVLLLGPVHGQEFEGVAGLVNLMRGAAVGKLGAYWNDDGVNLMHDEWFEPMAPETRAFFKLAREEGPDFIVSLHSHGSSPSVEPTAYAPRTMKETLKDLGDRVQKR